MDCAGQTESFHDRVREPPGSRRAAFAALAKQHEGDLLRAARRLCGGDDERARDVVQDALVRAYEAYLQGRFEARQQDRAWLLRILTNVFINDHHRRARQSTVERDLDSLVVADAGPAASHVRAAEVPGAVLLDQTLDEPLERALACLPEGLRLCVLLVDVEGLDYAEAARALDIPTGTVRSRLFRARLQLYGLLFDYGRSRRRV